MVFWVWMVDAVPALFLFHGLYHKKALNFETLG
jgi:hypothetical protein